MIANSIICKRFLLIPISLFSFLLVNGQDIEKKKKADEPAKKKPQERIVTPLLDENKGKELEILQDSTVAPRNNNFLKQQKQPRPQNGAKPVKINENDCPVAA